MKLIALAACAAILATPAYADIAGGDVELPSYEPVSWDVGSGKRCVASSFGQLGMLELIEDSQVVAAATVVGGKVRSALELPLLQKWCIKKE